MEQIDVKSEMARVQETLDGITKNGFWFRISFPEGDSLNLFPYRLEVLDANPEIGADGAVTSWLYSIMLLNRNFIEMDAMHSQHLLFVKRIEWVKGGSGRIYAATLFDEDGNKIIINEINAGEDPELAEEWRAYVQRLETMPEQSEQCRQSVIDEFMEMVEARFR